MPVTEEHITITILPDGRLRPNDAAAYLGVTPMTMSIWRCRGKGPRFVQLHRWVFYRREDLDDWVRQAGTKQSTKDGREAPEAAAIAAPGGQDHD